MCFRMSSPPVKCEGKRYLTFGSYPTDDVIKELETFDLNIWRRYDFRTKFDVFQHTKNGIKQSTHQNTYTLPLCWLLNSWTPYNHVTVYHFTDCKSLYHWAEFLHNILIKQGIEDGIIVKAMFAKLLPKKQIPSHTDASPTLQFAHRYHWVISSDQSVEFTINGKSSHWPDGHIYELNNILEHSVTNPSDTERIHFIMDIMPNKYITAGVTHKDVSRSCYLSHQNVFIDNLEGVI